MTMAVGKIIGTAHLVDATGAGGVVDPEPEIPLVAIGAVELSVAAVLPAAVVAWVGPGAGHRPGGIRRFQSDVDLQPYFHSGDAVEIDLYQGVIRHLTEGYAFPVQEVE